MGHGLLYTVYRHGPWSTVYTVYRHGPWSNVYSIKTWAMSTVYSIKTWAIVYCVYSIQTWAMGLLHIQYTDMGHGSTVYRVYRHGPSSTIYIV